jgi:hypothetical protein
MSSFDFLIGATASRQLLDFSPGDQWRAFHAIEILSDHPYATGLPHWVGADGQTNYRRQIRDWALTFSIDHAERKVRILEIEHT